MAKKAVLMPEPRNEAEIDRYIFEIGHFDRQITGAQADLQAKVERLKAEAAPHMKLLEDEITGRVSALTRYAEKHERELTQQGQTQTATFPSGQLVFRMTPPRVTISQPQAVLELLKAQGLTRFIRLTEQIDKLALLREPTVAGQVEGISITQRREIIVRLSDTKMGLSSARGRLKRDLPGSLHEVGEQPDD